MTESRIQVGMSQDYPNANKVTADVGTQTGHGLSAARREEDDITAMLMLGIL